MLREHICWEDKDQKAVCLFQRNGLQLALVSGSSGANANWFKSRGQITIQWLLLCFMRKQLDHSLHNYLHISLFSRPWTPFSLLEMSIIAANWWRPVIPLKSRDGSELKICILVNFKATCYAESLKMLVVLIVVWERLTWFKRFHGKR